MKWAVRIIAISTIIITIIAVILFTALLVGPPKPTFKLTGWEVTTNAVVSIEFTYTTDKSVEVVLINPKGEETDVVYLSKEATRGKISMTPFGVTPIPGTYRMIVTYLGSKVAEYNLTFVGAKISIGEISFVWKYYEWLKEYNLENLSIEIVNDGDLPAYVGRVSVRIDEEEINGFVMDWINPGRALISEEFIFWLTKPAGTYTVMIQVEDGRGNILAEKMTSITVP